MIGDENGPGGVNVKVRAIVDPKGIGCSRHGDRAFGLCAPCTLEMLDGLAQSAALPGLAHHARRVFVGLGAVLEANPDVQRFGIDSVDHRDDVVRVNRRDHTHAAISLATALARLETTLDYNGGVSASRVDLVNAARALGLDPDRLLALGRQRLTEATSSAPQPPPPPGPMPDPPKPDADPTSGFSLEPPEPDPRRRSIEDRRPSWWPGLRWRGPRP